MAAPAQRATGRPQVAAVRRGTPQPGWLFAWSLVALFGTVALAAVLLAWWIMD